MSIATDQDVYAGTVRLLRESGHDVVTATGLGLAQADDTQLLLTAQTEGRVFVTRYGKYGTNMRATLLMAIVYVCLVSSRKS